MHDCAVCRLVYFFIVCSIYREGNWCPYGNWRCKLSRKYFDTKTLSTIAWIKIVGTLWYLLLPMGGEDYSVI
jgi:hypothetical protein